MPEFIICELVHRKLFCYATLLTFLFVMGCNAHVHDSHKREPIDGSELTGISNSGLFTVDLDTANKSPPPVGQYHNWIISVTDQQSNPVHNASITINGGMPAHGHGLPTAPEVKKYLGDGLYLLEGMMFNMDGKWILQVHIMNKGNRDVVDFNFNVSY